MSQTVHSNDRTGNAFWVFLGILAILLGIVTASAIKHNPLYSDRDAYGISKYKFIQDCKEELQRPDDLTLNLQGQPTKLGDLLAQSKQLKPGEKVVVTPNATPSDLVNHTQKVDDGKIGLAAPVLIGAQSSDGQRPLAQATMQCVHDRATGKTEVMLGVGQ